MKTYNIKFTIDIGNKLINHKIDYITDIEIKNGILSFIDIRCYLICTYDINKIKNIEIKENKEEESL